MEGAVVSVLQKGIKTMKEPHHALEQSETTVIAIPGRGKNKQTGVSIMFMRSHFLDPMYPLVRSFNVVPWNSKIISCVEDNDTAWFRYLITNGLASPRDVDPDGESLLYVGIQVLHSTAADMSNSMPWRTALRRFFDSF
jgi:hypothetical protein